MSNWRYFRKLYDEDAVAAMAAVRADIEACGCGQGDSPLSAKTTPVPHIWARYLDGVFYNGGCVSGSRWYNPDTGEMVGRAHCTCDACF